MLEVEMNQWQRSSTYIRLGYFPSDSSHIDRWDKIRTDPEGSTTFTVERVKTRGVALARDPLSNSQQRKKWRKRTRRWLAIATFIVNNSVMSFVQ